MSLDVQYLLGIRFLRNISFISKWSASIISSFCGFMRSSVNRSNAGALFFLIFRNIVVSSSFVSGSKFPSISYVVFIFVPFENLEW